MNLGVDPGIRGVPLTIIEPTAWKRFHGLRGGDKETSRQRALQLFPSAHALLARKKITESPRRFCTP